MSHVLSIRFRDFSSFFRPLHWKGKYLHQAMNLMDISIIKCLVHKLLLQSTGHSSGGILSLRNVILWNQKTRRGKQVQLFIQHLWLLHIVKGISYKLLQSILETSEKSRTQGQNEIATYLDNVSLFFRGEKKIVKRIYVISFRLFSLLSQPSFMYTLPILQAILITMCTFAAKKKQ